MNLRNIALLTLFFTSSALYCAQVSEGKQEADTDSPAHVISVSIHGRCVAYSPSGQHLAVGGNDTLYLIDTETGATETIPFDTGRIRQITFHPKKDHLIFFVKDNEVGWYDLISQKKQTITSRKLRSRIERFSLSGNGEKIAIAKDIEVFLHDFTSEKTTRILDVNDRFRFHQNIRNDDIGDIALNSDGTLLALIGIAYDVQLFNAKTNTVIQLLGPQHRDSLSKQIAFTADDSSILFRVWDGPKNDKALQIIKYDTASEEMKELYTKKRERSHAPFAVTPDGDVLLMDDYPYCLKLIDGKEGSQAYEHVISNLTKDIPLAIACNSQGNQIATLHRLLNFFSRGPGQVIACLWNLSSGGHTKAAHKRS